MPIHRDHAQIQNGGSAQRQIGSNPKTAEEKASKGGNNKIGINIDTILRVVYGIESPVKSKFNSLLDYHQC